MYDSSRPAPNPCHYESTTILGLSIKYPGYKGSMTCLSIMPMHVIDMHSIRNKKKVAIHVEIAGSKFSFAR